MGGPQGASSRRLSRGRSLLVGALGFVVAGVVAGTVTVAGSAGAPETAATPTASAVPTEVAVRVLSVTRNPQQAGTVSVVLLNQGPAVRLDAARVEGAGYVPSDGGGFPGLAVRGSGSLFVSVRPDCSAGIGVTRRPELVLELATADGTVTTVRRELTGPAALPDELVGRCDAPLADGAQVSVRPVAAGRGEDVRLELTLVAGRGLLWVESLTGEVSLVGDGDSTIVVPPGETEVVDLALRISSCEQPPVAPQVLLRREPGQSPRAVPLADVGGRAYRDAVAVAVERICG